MSENTPKPTDEQVSWLKEQFQKNCEHDWYPSTVGGHKDEYTCRKCGKKEWW